MPVEYTLNSDVPGQAEHGWYVVITLPLNGLEVMVGNRLVPSHDGKIKIGFENQAAAGWLLHQIELGIERGTVDGKPLLAGEVIHDEQPEVPQQGAPVAGRRELG